MAGRLFHSFESGETHTANSTPVDAFAAWDRPRYLFRHTAVTSLDPTDAPPSYPSISNGGGCFSSRGTNGRCYRCGGGSGGGPIPIYTSSTTKSLASYNSAQGWLLGIVRNLVSPPLSQDEFWFSFEVCPSFSQWTAFGASDSGNSTLKSWEVMFRWGDVTLEWKASNAVSGTGDSSLVRNLVFALKNNGSEVATVTVPNKPCAGNVSVDSNWIWVLLHVKLHASSGVIECYIDGIAQDTPYENQNTVQTTSNVSAAAIFIGPMVWANNTTKAGVGALDNIYIDDAAFPNGRPAVRAVTPTDIDFVGNNVVNSNGGTLASANTIHSDSEEFQWNSSTASLSASTNDWPSSSGMSSEVLCIFGTLARSVSRNPTGLYNLKVHSKNANTGDEHADHTAEDWELPFASTTGNPGRTGSAGVCFEIFGDGEILTTDLSATHIIIEPNEL